MQTHCWIAFLRAINVGGHTVKMETLRALFEALGFTHVETFIASGNVIFEAAPAQAGLEGGAAALERQIEQHLQQSLGYAVLTFLRTPAELAAVAAYRPAEIDEAAAAEKVYIAFLKDRPDETAWQKVLGRRSVVDDFQLHGREIYWLRRQQFGESTFSGGQLEKLLGVPATLRNMSTIRKMAARYAPHPPDRLGRPAPDLPTS